MSHDRWTLTMALLFSFCRKIQCTFHTLFAKAQDAVDKSDGKSLYDDFCLSKVVVTRVFPSKCTCLHRYPSFFIFHLAKSVWKVVQNGHVTFEFFVGKMLNSSNAFSIVESFKDEFILVGESEYIFLLPFMNNQQEFT